MRRRLTATHAIARAVACLILTCLLALAAAVAFALMLAVSPVCGVGLVCAGAALRLTQERCHKRHR